MAARFHRQRIVWRSIAFRLAILVLGLTLAARPDALWAENDKNGLCASPYPEHGVYEAVIVYMIDEVITGDLFLPMDEDRNTLEYRQFAYDFFEEQFGLVFDVKTPGIQFISDGKGGEAFVWPLKPGVGSTHQVYGVDAQNVPQWRHKMPITKISLFDDGYFVFMTTDFKVHGAYGGAHGVVLPANTIVLAGFVKLFPLPLICDIITGATCSARPTPPERDSRYDSTT